MLHKCISVALGQVLLALSSLLQTQAPSLPRAKWLIFDLERLGGVFNPMP